MSLKKALNLITYICNILKKLLSGQQIYLKEPWWKELFERLWKILNYYVEIQLLESKLNVLRAQIQGSDDKWYYQYDFTTGEVKLANVEKYKEEQNEKLEDIIRSLRERIRRLEEGGGS